MRNFKFDKEAFLASGFYIFRNYLNSEELEEVNNIVKPYLNDKDIPNATQAEGYLCIKKVLENNHSFKDFLKHKEINAILHSIHNADFRVSRNDIMIKKVNGYVPVVWHREFDFFPIDNLITCVIALDHSKENLGGFSVIARSNKIAFTKRGPFANIQDVIEKDKDDFEVIDVNLNPGDLLFLHPLTYHTGSSNNSNEIKTAITIISAPN